MKIKTISLIAITYVFSFLPICLSADDLPEGTIKFFNVGQGNCALITAEERPPLLCDAGSLQFRPIRNDAARLVRPVVDNIVDALGNIDAADYGDRYPISLSVSHAAKDHMRFVEDILRAVSNRVDAPLTVRSIFGGGLADYNRTRYGRELIAYLENLRIEDLEEDEAEDDIEFDAVGREEFMRFGSNVELNGTKDWFLYRTNEDGDDRWDNDANILSHALGQRDIDIEPSNDNEKSVIIRAQVENWSAVITGDAARRNARGVIDNFAANNEMRSDVLLVSHHGSSAASIEASDVGHEWIGFIDPRFAVISSGKRVGYNHPGTDVIGRFLNFGGQANTLPPRFRDDCKKHRIYHYGNLNISTYLTYQSLGAWSRGRTKVSLYETYVNGHVSFVSGNNINPIVQYEGGDFPNYYNGI